jgi:hypothetical protein
MQHLQRLVGREGHQYWCGGFISSKKVPRFLDKMAARYSILRNTRERTYDRRRGRAVVHLVMGPPIGHAPGTPSATVLWWLVSNEGIGGLADPSAPDHHVAHDALSASTHIVAGDYVLLYATKRIPHCVTDPASSRPKRLWAQKSTWTWKIRAPVVSQIRVSIESCCHTLHLGDALTTDRGGWGLRGLLEAQRRRPLFSGVRNDVVELHRFALTTWARYRPAWEKANPRLWTHESGQAGDLVSINEIMAKDLPTMRQHRIYDRPPRTIRDLLE